MAGKNNASEVNEVMGTSVPDPSRLSWLLFVRVWASLFTFAGLRPRPVRSQQGYCSSKEAGHLRTYLPCRPKAPSEECVP